MRNTETKKLAIFLDGAIGVGKTTFGKSLAERFSGQFLDGDDFAEPTRPWYASSLSTNRQIFEATMTALGTTSIVFIAYPLRCFNWVFFERKLRAEKIEAHFVGLQASVVNIVSEARDRRLSASEVGRSKEMVEQGYGSRPFCDYFIRTDTGDVTEVTDKAEEFLREKLLG